MTNKIQTLSFRINPLVKKALREIAKKENRSITNMVEQLIIKYCHDNNIKIKEG